MGIYKTNQDIGRQLYFIVVARKAGQENKALQEQMGQVISENAKLQRKLAETEAQISQEYSLNPQTYNLIAARPIGLDRYLMIDKGSSDGVKIGQAVVFKDNYIGKVLKVSEKEASILLTSDPDSKIAAFSQGLDGRAKGVVKGEFGLGVTMEEILHEENIKEGDLVYSEGTEGFLPRGLILGKVVKVENQENQVFKKAKIEPIFDIRDLELVFLIT